MSKVKLKHESGLTKEVKQGWSWTIFFFGWIAMFIRGQVKEGIVSIGLYFLFIIPGFVYTLYMCSKGNEKLVESYLEKGYRIIEQ